MIQQPYKWLKPVKKERFTSGSKCKTPTARKRPPEKALARLIIVVLFLKRSLRS